MKKKMMFAVMAVLLISTVGISSAVSPGPICKVYEMSKRALSAVKARDCDRAMSILEDAMQIECGSLELTDLLESAYAALEERDLPAAGMFLRDALMLCVSLK